MGFPPPSGPGIDPGSSSRADEVIGDARSPIDRDIIIAAQEGDEEAITALWRHHAPHITRLLVAQQVTDSAAVTQRIWRRIGRAIGQFDGDGEAFRRWVLRITSATVRDARRSGPSPSKTANPGGLAGTAQLVDAAVADHLTAVAQLDVELAEVVMLRAVHGLSVADIAEITGESEGVVRQRLRDGTTQLRSSLGLLDDNGQLIDDQTEAIVTDPLRQPGTPSELAGAGWGMLAVVAGMENPAPVSSSQVIDMSRRRRWLGLAAAGVMLVAGTAAMGSLVRNGGPAASPQADSSGADTDAALPEGGSATAQRDGEPSIIQTAQVSTSTSLDPNVGDGDATGASDTLDTEQQTSDDDDDDDSTIRGEIRTNPNRQLPDNANQPAYGPPVPGEGPPQPTETNPPDDYQIPPEPSPTPTRPLVTDPPVVTSPPTTRPSVVTSPPTTDPPIVTSPPTTRPPSTSPPTTRPPATTSPPTTSPPTTSPPTTSPPTTSPPTTSPPTTEPPPTTSPPTTEPPPTTSPPTTEPPVTVPEPVSVDPFAAAPPPPTPPW